VLGELRLNEATRSAGLDLRHAIHRIDPFDPAHAAHVYGNNRPLLAGKASERLGNVGASTVGHQHDAGFDRRVDQRRYLRFIRRVDDVIRYARKAGGLEGIDLRDSVPVPVAKPDLCMRGDLIRREKSGCQLEEFGRFPGVGYRRGITAACFILDLEIDSDDGSEPWQQVRKDFPAQSGISVSGDGDRPFGVDGK
jgi:hypothetical protein